MIKKLVITSAFLCLGIVSTFAQQKFRFSFVASPQIGWMKSSDSTVDESKARFGFSFGIESDIFLEPEHRYSIVTGVLLSSMGTKQSYTEDKTIQGVVVSKGEEVKLGYKYLEIPLAIKLRSSQRHRSIFYAQFGLTNWLNIGSSVNTKDKTLNGKNIKDDLSFYNLGYNVGGGFEYDLGGKNALNIGIIYQNGFTDTTTKDAFITDASLRNVRLNLAFIF
ncbi:PorT family protein [Halosquirtibacter xylanolyticus]|uniref:outer membrane beta-barrel protein n=1 Tax=Halosquirtibacter xylanolyticus TaxID=3374599 RepID=UPI0037489FA8|nr:PorT family protein [Prolixibacteraceae bacterium]